MEKCSLQCLKKSEISEIYWSVDMFASLPSELQDTIFLFCNATTLVETRQLQSQWVQAHTAHLSVDACLKKDGTLANYTWLLNQESKPNLRRYGRLLAKRGVGFLDVSLPHLDASTLEDVQTASVNNLPVLQWLARNGKLLPIIKGNCHDLDCLAFLVDQGCKPTGNLEAFWYVFFYNGRGSKAALHFLVDSFDGVIDGFTDWTLNMSIGKMPLDDYLWSLSRDTSNDSHLLVISIQETGSLDVCDQLLAKGVRLPVDNTAQLHLITTALKCLQKEEAQRFLVSFGVVPQGNEETDIWLMSSSIKTWQFHLLHQWTLRSPSFESILHDVTTTRP